MIDPKYPEIVVKLIGEDGNAFAIIGAVKRAMIEAAIPKYDIGLFMEEAMEGDYNHLLRTAMKWVTVE